AITPRATRGFALSELLDDRLQVEHNVAVGRYEDPFLAVQDRHEELVRAPVRLAPELLDARPREQVVHRAGGRLLEADRDRWRQRAQIRRQPLLQALRHVDVRE